jgi:hypothetical protein
VVPPNQALEVFDALQLKGLPTACVLFEGEQHGFRRAVSDAHGDAHGEGGRDCWLTPDHHRGGAGMRMACAWHVHGINMHACTDISAAAVYGLVRSLHSLLIDGWLHCTALHIGQHPARAGQRAGVLRHGLWL